MTEKQLAAAQRKNTIDDLIESMLGAQNMALRIYDSELEDTPSVPEPVVIRMPPQIGVWKGGN